MYEPHSYRVKLNKSMNMNGFALIFSSATVALFGLKSNETDSITEHGMVDHPLQQ